MNNIIVGGDSFTFGNELSDDINGKVASKKTWAYLLSQTLGAKINYICCAKGGIGNSAIARNVFEQIATQDVTAVMVMWTFTSRYDWAMPPHPILEKKRWASITPWETKAGDVEAEEYLKGNEIQLNLHKQRQKHFDQAGVRPFADSLYKYAANDYHETYLSWKSITWLQNILEKHNIPYFFTLADNNLFYDEFTHKKDQDTLMKNLHNELDFTNWYSFGERMMGFNQWTILNNYSRGTTHPLDEAHQDAVKLMLPEFERIIGGQK